MCILILSPLLLLKRQPVLLEWLADIPHFLCLLFNQFRCYYGAFVRYFYLCWFRCVNEDNWLKCARASAWFKQLETAVDKVSLFALLQVGIGFQFHFVMFNYRILLNYMLMFNWLITVILNQQVTGNLNDVSSFARQLHKTPNHQPTAIFWP